MNTTPLGSASGSVSRRAWMKRNAAGAVGVMAAAWGLERASAADAPPASAPAGARPDGPGGDEVLPFLDAQPVDAKGGAVNWQELRDWLTPMKDFFNVSHYGMAKVEAEAWRLEVGGRVANPAALSLAEIKARPRREYAATLECSGNGASPRFMGAIGNARWAGTPLAPLLKECAVAPEAVEAAFWGVDKGKEKIRGAEYEQNFARCLSLKELRRDDLLLAYEMNGEPLTTGHGFPLRLIVPGWYGIAWVKWLHAIELRERPLANRFMARDYVTLRADPKDKSLWKETSVGPMNVKSLVGRVVRQKDDVIRVTGAAWTDGTPVKSVEVKIDNGDWQPAALDAAHAEPFTWRFWSFDWNRAKPGEHTLVSRAADEKGRVQPAADEPAIALKKTYYESNAQYPRRVKV